MPVAHVIRIHDIPYLISFLVYPFYSDYPRRGLAFYKGPQLVEDVYFAGFEKNDYYQSGAISWQMRNKYFTPIHSWVKNALFSFDDSVSVIFIYM